MRDVIFESILWRIDSVGVVRGFSLRHDQKQALLCKTRDVGVVRPIAKSSATTMQQVHHWQFPARCLQGRDDSVFHVPAQRGAAEGDVKQGDLRGETWMIRGRGLIALAAYRQRQYDTE